MTLVEILKAARARIECGHQNFVCFAIDALEIPASDAAMAKDFVMSMLYPADTIPVWAIDNDRWSVSLRELRLEWLDEQISRLERE